MGINREAEKETRPNGTDGQTGLSDEARHTLSADDAAPRVVDKRRFTRLLDAEAEPALAAEQPPRLPSFVEELETRLKLTEERTVAIEQAYREARENMEKEIEAIRERLNRTLEERVEQRRAAFIGNLVGVLDHLQRAVRSAEESANFQALLDGLRAIVLLFERQLESEGVSPIRPLSQPFDPRWHEAVDVVEVEPEQDGIVVEVIEPGFLLGEKTLIRPARVRVGRARTSFAADI